MLYTPYPAIAYQVLAIIRQRKAVPARSVRLGSSLRRKLGFDTVDIVDIILEVERHFQITIPDEVPLAHVQDFVGYVATQAPALRPPAENDSWTRAARGGYLPSYQSSS